MGIVIQLLANTLAVLASAYILKGVQVEGFVTALIVAIVLGLLNTFLKPILVLLTLPISLLTLGISILFINAIIILLAGKLVPGFHVDNFWWALLFGLVLSITHSFLNSLIAA